jgi:hypothetical protein
MMGLFDDLYGTPEPAPQTAKKPVKPDYKPLTPVAQPAPVVPPAAQAVDAEFVPSKPPPGLSPRALNDFKLSEANRIAAAKIKKAEEERAATRKLEEDQRNATTKPPAEFMAKAKKLKDFEGFLTDYKQELYKDLMVFPKEIPLIPSQGMAIPLPVGSDTARMNSKYTALLMGLKDAYELGALTGPDMSIVEAQITNPATIAGALTSRDAMKEQVKVMEGLLNRSKQNLESSYGKKMDFGMPPDGAGAVNPANDPLGLRPRRP